MIRSILRTASLAILTAAVAAGIPSRAAADFVPISQQRSVSAIMTGRVSIWFPSSNPFFPDFDPPDQVVDTPNGPIVSSAPDLTAFSDVVVVSDTIAGIQGTATVAQDSIITSELISATGSHDVQLDGANGQVLGNYAVRSNLFDSISTFTTTFSVAEDTEYTLQADLVRSLEWALEPIGFLPHVNADVVVELSGPGGVIVSAAAPESSTCPPASCAVAQIDSSGVLTPGTYTLTAYATGIGYSDCLDVGGGVTCFNAQGTASYAVDLSVGAPAVSALPLAGHMSLGFALVFVGRRALTRRVIISESKDS